MRALAVLRLMMYYHSCGVTLAEVGRTSWQKSSLSNLNGNCVEVGFLPSDRIGVRDTKDKGRGPALIFSASEWNAFITAVKLGEFDKM